MNKGYNEIVKTALLVEYKEEGQFWVEHWVDEEKSYRALFTEQSKHFPLTIETHAL